MGRVGLGQEVFEISRVRSKGFQNLTGRVKLGREVFEISRVADPRKMTRPVKTPGK